MKWSTTKFGRSAITPVLCALVSLALFAVGCASTKDSPLSDKHDLPAHYPKDLADGAKRIEQLLVRISAGETTSRWQQSNTSHAQDLPTDAFEELRDLVGWLPNLAADSDLGEGDWVLAGEVAEQLREPIERLVSMPVAERNVTFQPQLASLRETLDKLNPVVVRFQELQSRYSAHDGTAETPTNESETR